MPLQSLKKNVKRLLNINNKEKKDHQINFGHPKLNAWVATVGVGGTLTK